jgi:hypothetical protein
MAEASGFQPQTCWPRTRRSSDFRVLQVADSKKSGRPLLPILNRVAQLRACLSLANCYFAHDSSGFPRLATILRCAIWSFWSFCSSTSAPPWPGWSDLAARVP